LGFLDHVHSTLVCVDCRTALHRLDNVLRCESCGSSFPVEAGIADFARGHYYDSFDPERDTLTEEHVRGLELEFEGSVRRIADFYIPLMKRVAPAVSRILDAGCGNGVSVDVLRRAGFDAWGNDLSELRKFQWREREHRENLVVASALQLPFPGGYFDAVISSGVVEHIGVAETPAPHYSVRPLANQRELRVDYLRELARVVRPGGHVFIDCPNGAFPIDFWHGNSPGSPRVHSLRENFLPSFREVRTLAEVAVPGAKIRAHSPRRRLQFKQSASHMHGRFLRAPLSLAFRAMEIAGFRWLARTAINPFLVVEVSKP
jgi:SAM-dependent methyltransferase